jgi:mRNA interferase RelE/StbE
MLLLDLTPRAFDFWNGLEAKPYRQIGRKVLSLLLNPRPPDKKVLMGAPGYFRVDCGEYRIIYRLDDDVLRIALMGKRNDDRVYEIFNRKTI